MKVHYHNNTDMYIGNRILDIMLLRFQQYVVLCEAVKYMK